MSEQNKISNRKSNLNDEVHFDTLSIRDFSTELGSDSPTPGGGSTAALAGLMAASLVSMVSKISQSHSTIGSEREIFEPIITKAGQYQQQFMQLINDDTMAFNKIYKCYQLPKATEFQKKARTGAIQAATKHAAEVPLDTARLGVEVLGLVDELTRIGYDRTITDTGVACLMAYSAVLGACWNVKINLRSLKDNDYINEKSIEVEEILNKTNSLYIAIKTTVEQKI